MRSARARTAVLAFALLLVASLDAAPAYTAPAQSTIWVTTTADLNTCQPGAVSLRCAIARANADGSGDTIAFSINCPGVCVIRPSRPLPNVTATNTTIDGYTQHGAQPNTNPLSAGDNAIIRIRIDGAQVATGHVGLYLAGSHDVVRGLSITGFLCTTYAGYCLSNGIDGTNGTNGDGVYIDGHTASNVVVEGNFIGVTPDGKTAAPNSYGLIVDRGLGNHTLGGTTVAAANLISGNAGDGLDLISGGNTVVGNLLGTTASGSAPLGNAGFGIWDLGVGPNRISSNVASGNGGGIGVAGPKGDVIDGNLVGTNAAGTAALANNAGVDVDYTSGPNTLGPGNVISGNSGTGVSISSASGTLIQRNHIGTDATGKIPLANGYHGISVDNQSSRNVISGNTIKANVYDGVSVANLYHASGNRIEANDIEDNGGNGVSFDQNWATSTQDSGATVGGATAAAGNVIAHNGQSGVVIGIPNYPSIRVAVLHNSMFANAGLGIDLAPQGTVNCATTGQGPNDYVACPVIGTATTTHVSGTACSGCTVEVFIASAAADDQGHGEGKTFLSATTAGPGGAWSVSLAQGQLSAGQLVTATATKASATSLPGTSEFALNVVASP
jgi:hypothetical protein